MIEGRVLLDANVPMYAGGREHSYRESCSWIMSQVAAGRIDAAIDTETVQEIVYRYFFINRPDIGIAMAKSLVAIVSLILPVDIDEILLFIEYTQQYGSWGLQPRDAIHIAVMLRHGIEKIISADRHFDGISGIQRLDPLQMYSSRG